MIYLLGLLNVLIAISAALVICLPRPLSNLLTFGASAHLASLVAVFLVGGDASMSAFAFTGSIVLAALLWIVVKAAVDGQRRNGCRRSRSSGDGFSSGRGEKPRPDTVPLGAARTMSLQKDGVQ